MSLFGGFRQLELHSEELDCFRRIRNDQIQGDGTLKNRSECDMKHLSVQISPSFDAPDTFEIAAGYMPVMEFEKEFGISIPDDQAEKIGTVGDAINYIEEHAK